MRPFVGFDLDEVLLGMRDLVHASLARRLGGYPHWAYWSDFLHFERFAPGRIDLKGFLDAIIEDEILENAPMEPGALQAVQEIRAMGLRTAVITARGYHPRGEQVTHDWLAKHGFEMDEVCVVGVRENKAERVRALGPMIAYIDDHAKNLDQLEEAGVGGVKVLHVRPWSAAQRDRFASVESIEEYPEVVRSVMALA
jgi:hypothetical protein